MSFLPIAASFLLGIASHAGHFSLLPLSFLLFPLWFFSRCRSQAFFIAQFYYMGATSLSGPNSIINYLSVNLAVGLLLWFLFCLCAALPALVWCSNRKYRPLSFALFCVLSCSPLLALFAVGFPIIHAGAIFPSTGLWGLLAFFVIIYLFFQLPTNTNSGFVINSLFAFITVVGIISNAFFSPSFDNTHTSTTTTFSTAIHGLSRPNEVASLVATSLSNNDNILVLPENTIIANSLLERNVTEVTALHPLNIIAGVSDTYTPAIDDDANIIADIRTYHNGSSEVVYKQRVPIPIAMYNPFAKNYHPLHLFDTGSFVFNNHTYRAAICYEILVPYLAFIDGFSQPDYVITIGNLTWFSNNNMLLLETVYTLSVAKLYGATPVLALNLPPVQ